MQHGLRRHFVGGVSGILRRLERGKQEWARTRHAGIDEQGEIAPFQINRVLDLELEIGDQLEFGPLGPTMIPRKDHLFNKHHFCNNAIQEMSLQMWMLKTNNEPIL